MQVLQRKLGWLWSETQAGKKFLCFGVRKFRVGDDVCPYPATWSPHIILISVKPVCIGWSLSGLSG